MNKSILMLLAALALWTQGSSAFAAGEAVIGENIPAETLETARYFRVNIDRVEIDTAGLVTASGSLAQSIDRLAASIGQLSSNAEALSDEERAALLSAVKSVDQASLALSSLAAELPQTARALSEQLPRVVNQAREPIAELSSGLQSARDGIYAITASLPQATENAKTLVNAALDAALWRLSIYSLLLIALLALALIGVAWFVYRQYLDPIARKLDALSSAPEHFADMARCMQQTSANLLALRQAEAAVSVIPDAAAAHEEPAATERGRDDGDTGADKNRV